MYCIVRQIIFVCLIWIYKNLFDLTWHEFWMIFCEFDMKRPWLIKTQTAKAGNSLWSLLHKRTDRINNVLIKCQKENEIFFSCKYYKFNFIWLLTLSRNRIGMSLYFYFFNFFGLKVIDGFLINLILSFTSRNEIKINAVISCIYCIWRRYLMSDISKFIILIIYHV